jgi:hypothetical protein
MRALPMKQAYLFYEANDPAPAMKFVMAVRQTVDAIEKAPLRFPVVFEEKARVAKFPFVVYYVTDSESIIIACLHDRRNPKIVLERLRALGPSPNKNREPQREHLHSLPCRPQYPCWDFKSHICAFFARQETEVWNAAVACAQGREQEKRTLTFDLHSFRIPMNDLLFEIALVTR